MVGLVFQYYKHHSAHEICGDEKIYLQFLILFFNLCKTVIFYHREEFFVFTYIVDAGINYPINWFKKGAEGLRMRIILHLFIYLAG